MYRGPTSAYFIDQVLRAAVERDLAEVKRKAIDEELLFDLSGSTYIGPSTKKPTHAEDTDAKGEAKDRR